MTLADKLLTPLTKEELKDLWGMNKQELELAKQYGMTLEQWRKL